MKKILVVNNDFDTMSLLKSWLERKDYQIRYTGNGEEVVQLVKEFSPDLILIDILTTTSAFVKLKSVILKKNGCWEQSAMNTNN